LARLLGPRVSGAALALGLVTGAWHLVLERPRDVLCAPLAVGAAGLLAREALILEYELVDRPALVCGRLVGLAAPEVFQHRNHALHVPRVHALAIAALLATASATLEPLETPLLRSLAGLERTILRGLAGLKPALGA